jgi:BTB/POZ domain-containing protein 9
MDQKDWVRVIDHIHYFCRSWQYLYFEPRVVRYIRIVGTNNTVNKVFHVVSFEAMFTHNNVELQNGLIGKFMLSIILLLCFSLIVKPRRTSRDFNVCIRGRFWVLCKSR